MPEHAWTQCRQSDRAWPGVSLPYARHCGCTACSIGKRHIPIASIAARVDLRRLTRRSIEADRASPARARPKDATRLLSDPQTSEECLAHRLFRGSQSSLQAAAGGDSPAIGDTLAPPSGG